MGGWMALTGALTATARAFGRASRVFLYLGIGTERLARFREGVELLWGDPWPAAGDGGSLFPVERELFERFIPPRSRVLVIGCGGGRDLVALEALGHTMTGVEPSRSAMELCETALRDQGRTATLVRGFFEDAPRQRAVRRDRVLVLLLQLHPRVGAADRLPAQGREPAGAGGPRVPAATS